MATHVRIPSNLLDKLKKRKEDTHASSVADVIARLLRDGPGIEEGKSDSSSSSDDDQPPPKHRKFNVREPFYSFVSLADREGMLHYLTGFDRPVIELLIRRFQEVVFVSSVSSCVSFVPLCRSAPTSELPF
jgi:hypothetical protein